MSDCEVLFGGLGQLYTSMLLSSVMIPEPGKGIPENSKESQLPSPTDLSTACGFDPRCSVAQPKCRIEIPVLQSRGGGGSWLQFYHGNHSGRHPDQE